MKGLKMDIHLISKGHSLPEDFKPIAEKKLSHLTKYNVKLERVKIEVLLEKHPKHKIDSHFVKITCIIEGEFFHGEGRDIKDVAALDIAVSVIDSQLRKLHSKKTSSKTTSPKKVKNPIVMPTDDFDNSLN